ncbi:MAG: hypothetical protein PHF29_09810 [Candidatus Riflebacteria bacterium]|nr:hypothetical protein [Candidatus Riflebacteria bacterium]
MENNYNDYSKSTTNATPTKKCKHCQTDIPKKAKICPNCKKRQSMPVWAIILIVFVVFVILGSFSTKGDSTTTNAETTDKTESTEAQEGTKEVEVAEVVAEEVEVEEVIEYTTYEVGELLDDLNNNALKAESKYSEQYVELSGELSNIDSDGKYISITPSDEEFAIIGVQCYLMSDEQKDKVMEMSKGDVITVRGKITSVGEVMGYSLDIDEFK